MKKFILGSVGCVWVAAGCFASYSYNLSIVTGYNLIADNLVNDQNGNGNDLNDILPASVTPALAGCFLFKFDNASATWVTSFNYGGATGWSPNISLNPGEGAFLANPGSTFSLTFSGAESPSITPVSAPNGLYSAQDFDGTYSLGPSPAYNYADVVGSVSAVPANQTQWLNWTGAANYATKKYASGLARWTGSGSPQAAVGEAVWIFTPPAPQPSVVPPLYLANFLAPSAGQGGWPYNLTIVWPTSVSGSPAYLQESSDMVNWTYVMVGGMRVTSPYSVATSLGSFLYFRLAM